MWFPPRDWTRHYGTHGIRRDLVAGVTTAAVVIPQAMAYATIAGLPLQSGLYCALLPMAAYAFFGTSRPLSVSTTSTISLLTAQAIAASGAEPLAAAVALAALSGAFLLVAGVLRLGFLADFMSPHALLGFKIGTGLLIIVDQVGKVIGIDVVGADFFEKAVSVVTGLDQANLVTVALGAASVAALLVLKRSMPGAPGPLIVLVLGIVAVGAFSLDSEGVSLAGGVPAGLPDLGVPDWDLLTALIAPAAGIALMAFVESIGAARTFRRPEDAPIEANQELRALGLASLVGSFSQAFPTGGGLSQTAVNDSSGASTQAAGLVTSIMVLLTIVILAPLFDDLADATLGAIVLVAAAGLVDLRGLAALRWIEPIQWGLAALALVVVLIQGTLAGVLVGVIVSLLHVLHVLNRPSLATLSEDGSVVAMGDGRPTPARPGIAIVRVVLPVYYANQRRILDSFEDWLTDLGRPPEQLIVELPAQTDVGPAFVDFVSDLKRTTSSRDIDLHLAGIPSPAQRMLEHSPRWGELYIPSHRTVRDALAAPGPR